MTISIIIPVYQVERYIERCLLSILSQDCKDFEIILVDDASCDGSMALARKVLENVDIPVSYLIHEKNRGLSAARNTGIDAAKGEYLLFLDSDDTMTEGAIDAFVEQIRETDADCIIGNYKVVSDTSEYVSKRYAQKIFFTSTKAIREAYRCGEIPIMAWNKCIKTNVVREKKLYFKDGIYHEDELWTFLLVNEVSTLSLIGTLTYTYYIRGGSIMTHTKSDLRLSSGIAIYQEMVDYIEKNKLEDNNLKICMDIFAFQRYRDIFSMSNDSYSAKCSYRKMRLNQKRVGRSNGKWGIAVGAHLLFPTSIGYYFMKEIMKLY